MVSEPPVHCFDRSRARAYRPNPAHSKTAILVDIADASVTTSINAPFGVQRFRGPFYIVAEGAQSYGVAKREFDNSHIEVGQHRWTKSKSVLAYQAEDRSVVETYIDDHRETSVVAEPGAWIVRQSSGEVMVLTPKEFVERYIADNPAVDPVDDGPRSE